MAVSRETFCRVMGDPALLLRSPDSLAAAPSGASAASGSPRVSEGRGSPNTSPRPAAASLVGRGRGSFSGPGTKSAPHRLPSASGVTVLDAAAAAAAPSRNISLQRTPSVKSALSGPTAASASSRSGSFPELMLAQQGESDKRFRNPNQEVTWHGRSSALTALRASSGEGGASAAVPLTSTGSLARAAAAADVALPATTARASDTRVPAPAPKSALSGGLTAALGAQDAANAALRGVWVKQNVAEGLAEQVGGRGPGTAGVARKKRGMWGMDLNLADFLVGPKLGEGLTGRVHYARLKVRGSECALKVMRKAKLIELGEEHHVMSEVEALARVRSPFVTQLQGSFQDSRALYLCIEYMRGPDLFAYMHEINAGNGDRDRNVPLGAVRFYMAQARPCLGGLLPPHVAHYVASDRI